MGAGSFKLLFLFLMGSGIPVAIAMAGASLIYVMVSGTIPDYVVIHRMVGGLDSFPLLAVPFFILAGNLMNSAGITNRIYNFALALVGWMRGGLGHVNIVGSVVFAGMSGTAIADAAGLGVFQAAKESKGIRVIGSNSDQNHVAPDVTLGSVAIDLPQAFLRVAREVKEGRFKPRVISMGLHDNIVKLIMNPRLESSIPASVRASIDSAHKALDANGTELEQARR